MYQRKKLSYPDGYANDIVNEIWRMTMNSYVPAEICSVSLCFNLRNNYISQIRNTSLLDPPLAKKIAAMQNRKQEQLIRANNVQLHMNYSLESGAIFVLGTCILHTNNDLFRTPNKCFNIPSSNHPE